MSGDGDSPNGLLTFAVMALLVIPMAMYNAWAGWLIYNWFIPVTFDFMPELSFGETIGVSIVTSYFFINAHAKAEEDGMKALAVFLFRPLFALLFAIICKHLFL